MIGEEQLFCRTMLTWPDFVIEIIKYSIVAN